MARKRTQRLSALPLFKYPTLGDGESRVVALHPGLPGDDLVVSIDVTHPSRVRYNAVSYVWGDNSRVHNIYAGNCIEVPRPLPGKPDNVAIRAHANRPTGIIKVTENLRQLLLGVRHEKGYLQLWVDSLCINQDDDVEKSLQVSRMTTIFGMANVTIIWLGHHNQTKDMALKYIHYLAHRKSWPKEYLPKTRDYIEYDKEGQPLLAAVHPVTGKCATEELQKTLRDDLGWVSLTAFMDNPWFHRVWIVQEIILSHNPIIKTSQQTLPWSTLVNACEVIQRADMYKSDTGREHVNIPTSIEEQRVAMLSWQRDRANGIRPMLSPHFDRVIRLMHFARLQLNNRGCGATDPRDHVFALQSIAQCGYVDLLEVDYSLSLVEVYIRLVCQWAKAIDTNPLSWLTGVNGSYFTKDLPTWVPDWRIPWRLNPFGVDTRWEVSRGGLLKCHFVMPDLITPMTMPCHITIRGCRIAVIKETEKVKGSDRLRKGRHAEIINQFPEPYPTTYLSYREAFHKSVAPRRPKLNNLQGHPRSESFWSFKAAPCRKRLRPLFTGDAAKFTQFPSPLVTRFHDQSIDDARFLQPPRVNLITQPYLMSPITANPPPSRSQSPVPPPKHGIGVYVPNEGSHRSTAEPQYTQQELYHDLPDIFLQDIFVTHDDFIRGRCWFMTEDGFMGLAHEIAEAGDVIVQLYGGRLLYLLRKKRVEVVEGEGRAKDRTIWGFVCEVFVLGLMNGELLDEAPDDIDEDFVLE